MKLDLAGVLADAWAMARRDRELLIGVAGVFVLVPQIAQAMFVAKPPALPESGADPAALQAWLDAFTLWSKQNDLMLLAFATIALFGSLVLFTLYVARPRPDVATALRGAVPLLPRYLLLALLVSFPVSVGWALLWLPGLYLKGRLMAVGAAFVAEQPLGTIAAWRRSFALTRGHGLVLMALACVPLVAGRVVALPLEAIGQLLDGAPMANPVVAAVIDCCTGLGYAAATVASILIEVALYRRLSRGI